MKKEEILEKAKAEKNDEMESFFGDKSMLWVIAAMFACMCVFSFTRLEIGQPVEDHCATLGIAVAVGHIYRYIKTKKRESLVIGICFGAAGIVWTVLYFLKYFGVG
ncbi:MAG: DUF6442 family protein [Lachnospiraceae bacterium]|nr:DUF6442 family protein [Ruminococcus sp.]MCM1274097.1 DUF6442 family protein [Lachnospiraceae bacterium]